MTELVAALFTVHGSLSFLANVDRLLGPSGGSVWFRPTRWTKEVITITKVNIHKQISFSPSGFEPRPPAVGHESQVLSHPVPQFDVSFPEKPLKIAGTRGEIFSQKFTKYRLAAGLTRWGS